MSTAIVEKPPRAVRRSIGRALEEVRDERKAQYLKWGEQNHLDGTGLKGDAALATYAKQTTDMRAELGVLTYRDILHEEVREAYAESDTAKLRAELIQVAAVAVAWVEAIDRRVAE